MKLVISLFAIIFLCWPMAEASAQSSPEVNANPTPPPGPLVQMYAPKFSSWTITTEKKGAVSLDEAGNGEQGKQSNTDASPSARKPETGRKVIQVTKTGDLRLIVTTTDTGSIETWCAKNWQVTKKPEWKEPVVSDGENPDDSAWTDFSSGDFPGFQWLSNSNYLGSVKLKGHDCMVFKDRVQMEKPLARRVFHAPGESNSTPPPVDPESLKVPVIAYIDLETRLPVILVSGDKISTYAFGSPPAAPLVFPPDVKTALMNSVQKFRQMLAAPAKP